MKNSIFAITSGISVMRLSRFHQTNFRGWLHNLTDFWVVLASFWSSPVSGSHPTYMNYLWIIFFLCIFFIDYQMIIQPKNENARRIFAKLPLIKKPNIISSAKTRFWEKMPKNLKMKLKYLVIINRDGEILIQIL